MTSKKLILTGPPGTGKTTIKKIFFDMVNPIQLLKDSLEPTRGVDSSIFSFFEQELGIFDLAGQENEDWFSKDKKIFESADLIICVLDINSHVKDILEFVKAISELYGEMKLKCQVTILLHKIDLVDSLYLRHKLELINKEIETIEKLKIKIYTTSIAKDFFLDMFKIFSDIISGILKQEKLISGNLDIKKFEMDLNILLKYEISEEMNIKRLFYDFNLSTDEAKSHLLRLHDMGFVEYDEKLGKFTLSEKVSFLNPETNITDESKREYQITKILESLFIFSKLKKI